MLIPTSIARRAFVCLMLGVCGASLAQTATQPPAPRVGISQGATGAEIAKYYAEHAGHFDASTHTMTLPGGSPQRIPGYAPPVAARRLQETVANEQAPQTRMTIGTEPTAVGVQSGGRVAIRVVLRGVGPASVAYALVSPGQSPSDPALPHGELRWSAGQSGALPLVVTAPTLGEGEARREVRLVLFAPYRAALGANAGTRIVVAGVPEAIRRSAPGS